MHLRQRNAALLPVRWPREAAEWDSSRSIIPHLRTSLLCRRSAVQSESSTARILRSLAGCIQHTLPLTQNHGWRGRSRGWDPIPTDSECWFAFSCLSLCRCPVWVLVFSRWVNVSLWERSLHLASCGAFVVRCASSTASCDKRSAGWQPGLPFYSPDTFISL